MGVEREIRFRVTEGEPRAEGRPHVQAYLLRGRVTLRVRRIADGPARLTLKAPRFEGRFEWECAIPVPLARALLALPLPRVEKTRHWEGELEVDRVSWPERMVLVECELAAGEGPDLRDASARRAWMEARRPSWVAAWADVTDDPRFTNARIARRRPWRASRAPR